MPENDPGDKVLDVCPNLIFITVGSMFQTYIAPSTALSVRLNFRGKKWTITQDVISNGENHVNAAMVYARNAERKLRNPTSQRPLKSRISTYTIIVRQPLPSMPLYLCRSDLVVRHIPTEALSLHHPVVLRASDTSTDHARPDIPLESFSIP